MTRAQQVLPFTGLSDPGGVAVDGAGTLYVTDAGNNRVLKLPTGANTQTELALSGLKTKESAGVAVDTAGNVYVAESGPRRVAKLPA